MEIPPHTSKSSAEQNPETETENDKYLEHYEALRPLKLNPEDYREIWADYEMTDEQYNELIEIIREIGQSFVLMGWNEDISQILFASALKNARPDSDKLLKDKYSKAADGDIEHTPKKESDDD